MDPDMDDDQLPESIDYETAVRELEEAYAREERERAAAGISGGGNVGGAGGGAAPTVIPITSDIANVESAPKVSVRRQYAKLDAERLKKEGGLDYIKKKGPKFKYGGKGKEIEDLHRLMEMYQVWGHSVFPSLRFRPFIEGVERVCRQRPMKVWLQDALRDENLKRAVPIHAGDFDD
ncbi:replication fork protection component Swi3-domain-containing protein [Chytridium lagenaria]|nr:replication fork protection component Swi3-domain-containing protein [Chytridium lagenaria]